MIYKMRCNYTNDLESYFPLQSALFDKIDDREMIFKGIKVSHYYEELSRTYTIQKHQIEVWHKIEQL